jgi:hypothetical protein
MAETPALTLNFGLENCGDCGTREVVLPRALPFAGDDFAWKARDYDALRQFMMEELASRFPERKRWTAADMEVVIVEAFAAMLDQFSDATDKVFSEGMLETARQPQSVRRLLSFIGFDALAHSQAEGQTDGTAKALEEYWRDNPFAMAAAKSMGVSKIHDQARMVSVSDYAARLDDHPLVLRVNARMRWTGSWETVVVAIILPGSDWRLDQHFDSVTKPTGPDALLAFSRRIAKLQSAIDSLHIECGVLKPTWSEQPTFRSIISDYIDALRLAGQPVTLADAIPIGIVVVASINVGPDYYQSEVRHAALESLGNGGFFKAGNLRFGEDIFASDIIARLMDLSGVLNVCLIRFKRVGSNHPDESESGRITLDGLEVAVCDNMPGNPSRGYLSFKMLGGRKG